MDRLLDLMLFVYYRYTIHLIPKDLRRGFDITVEELTKGDTAVGLAVAAAKIKVEFASKQRKPVLVDQDGQPLSAEDLCVTSAILAEKDSTEPF